MSATRVLRLLAPLLLAAALLSAPVSPAEAAGDPVKILAAGDSITQSRDGDFSWRQLVWNKFQQDSGTNIDFIGSRTDGIGGGTHPRLIGSSWPDRNHFALSNRTSKAGLAALPAELAADGAPDVVVIEYGTNDLGIYGYSVNQSIGYIKQFINTVKAVNGNAKFVLVDVANVAGGAAYNARLDDLAAAAPAGTMSVAHFVKTGNAARDWVVADDTWDHDHHPTPSGDEKIANAIVKALKLIGVGNGLPVDQVDPQWDPRPPTTLTFSARTQKATMSFDPTRVDATSFRVEYRAVTDPRVPWPHTSGVVTGTSWTSYTLAPGVTYDFRLIPIRGFMVGKPTESMRVTADNVVVSNSITYDSAGNGRIGVSCAKACEGYVRVQRAKDDSVVGQSSVGHYKLKAGTWSYVPLSGLGAVGDGPAFVRVSVITPAWVDGINPHYLSTTLTKEPAPNVSVVGSILVNPDGTGSAMVKCAKACTGYLQIWTDGTDVEKSAVTKYTIKAGQTAKVRLSGLPMDYSLQAQARFAQTTPVVGTNPHFQTVELDPVPLSEPERPNVYSERQIVLTPGGKSSIRISCYHYCHGTLWVRSDVYGTHISNPVDYKLAGGQAATYPVTGITWAKPFSSDAQVKIKQTATNRVLPDPAFRTLSIVPNVTTSASITYDSTGKPRIGVACVKACSGSLQIMSGTVYSTSSLSSVSTYSVPAGSYRFIPLTNVPEPDNGAAGVIRVTQNGAAVGSNDRYLYRAVAIPAAP